MLRVLCDTTSQNGNKTLETLAKGTSVPNYDEWRNLNTSFLYESCAKKDSLNCDFRVASSYNFSGQYWLSNGHRLDEIIWKSFAYPSLNDIITICGFVFDPTKLAGENKLTHDIDSNYRKWGVSFTVYST